MGDCYDNVSTIHHSTIMRTNSSKCSKDSKNRNNNNRRSPRNVLSSSRGLSEHLMFFTQVQASDIDPASMDPIESP